MTTITVAFPLAGRVVTSWYAPDGKFHCKVEVVISCSERTCGTSWTMPDEEVPAALERGDIVVRAKPQAGYSTMETVGVCTECQAKHRLEAKQRPRRGKQRNVEAEHRELMQLVARTREVHPDWSLKRCVKAAVDFVNSPAEERDPAFRAWLLDRVEHEA